MMGKTKPARFQVTGYMRPWSRFALAFALAALWPGLATAQGTRPDKEVFGADDRLDIFEETNAQRLDLAKGVVMLVNTENLEENLDGSFSFVLDQVNPLCSDQPFADQPTVGFCSGFLVAEDIIVSNGHCIRDDA